MESLLKELGDGTFQLEETSELVTEETEQERIFKDAWKNIMGDIDPSMTPSTSTAPASAAQSTQKGSEGSFQDRVKKTMDKMKEGQSSLKVRDPPAGVCQRPDLSSPAMGPATPTWRPSCRPWATWGKMGRPRMGCKGFWKT